MSRCLSCNDPLTDSESTRKYSNHEEIVKPEDKFIGLCDCCYYPAFKDDESLERFEAREVY